MANATYPHPAAAVTVALEQNILSGAVDTGTLAGPAIPVPRGGSSSNSSSWVLPPGSARWVSHRNVTYVALAGPGSTPTLRAQLGDQTGSWGE